MKSPIKPPASQWIRYGKRGAFVLASLLTLAACFYEEENWRGERAWKNYHHQLEAMGEKMDLAAFNTPPIPDEKNFFKDPMVAKAVFFELGKQWQTNWLTELQGAGRRNRNAMTPITLGRIRVLTNSIDPSIPAVSQFKDPAAFEAYLRKAFGFRAVRDPRGNTIVEEIYAAPEPVREISLRCGSKSDIDRIWKLVERRFLLGGSRWGPFEVKMLNFYISAPASSILEDCEPRKVELDALYRAAEQRPLARDDQDWSARLTGNPGRRPLKFASAGAVALFGAVHAKACLVTENPGGALRDLTVMARSIEADRVTPSWSIAQNRIAQASVYAEVVGEGLALHLWREVDLAEIQNQLSEVDVIKSLALGVRGSRIINGYVWPLLSRANIQRPMGSAPDFRRMFYLSAAPQGWWFDTLRSIDEWDQAVVEWLDAAVTNGVAGNFDGLTSRLNHAKKLEEPSAPMHPLAQDLLAVVQIGCDTQTRIRLAIIACGLERLRLSGGSYPEHLPDIPTRLLPPNRRDFFSGQPMRYVKQGNAYQLYSVGWNRKDDLGAGDDIRWSYSDANP